MAGDLLGDHWPLNESIPVLLRTATQASGRAARHGALHGMKMALLRPELTEEQKVEVLRVVKAIAEKDRSRFVRASARLVLKAHSKYEGRNNLSMNA
jgi:hypothetical protein